MDWKEIFKVSGILGVVSYVLFILTDVMGGNWNVEIAVVGLVGTGLILNRRLNRKEDWGIVIGMIISMLVCIIISYLTIDVLGL
ncbi:MAG: hypothetical protein AABW48_06255 [Nanoarchaeota archaeon]